MGLRAAAIVLFVTAGCATQAEVLEIDHAVLSVEGREETVALPAHLDLPRRDLEYTLRAEVDLPDALRDRTLDLRIVRLPARVRVEGDGEVLDDIAPPLLDGYRVETPRAFRIPQHATRDGHVSLRITVAHRWTRSAWWDTRPVLLPAEARHDRSELGRVLDLVFAAAGFVALVQIGVSCVLVYLVDRRRKAYLWFGIQGLSAAYYPLYVLGVPQLVLGRFDVPVLAIALVVAPIVSVWFTRAFFALGEPGVGWRVALALACVVPLLASSPYFTTQIAGPVTVGIVAVVCVYQLSTCARLMRRGNDRTSAALLFTCWIALTVSVAPDMALWLGLGAPLGAVHGGSLGLATFAFFLSLLLSRSHIVSIAREGTLNDQLAQRVAQLETRGREIEALNAELRRQIGDRSAQIYAALALIERGAIDAPRLAPGEVVQGRYRVLRAIGAGGMGSVHEVERLSDGKRFALKLTRDLGGGALARLAREARIAAQIDHPNVVGVVDVDVAAAGFLYLVMELVEGPSLRDARRTGDARWSVRVLAQIARGLEALHDAGIVHRDLKPANVVLTGDPEQPRAKIADFGISRWTPAMAPPRAHVDEGRAVPLLLPLEGAEPESTTTETVIERAHALVSEREESSSDEGPPLTETGLLPGTPLYIAPELARGHGALRPASDLFAFGVLAYELLIGRRPFDEPVALAVLEGRSPPPRLPLAPHWPDGDPAIVAILEACLALDPGERPSAREVAEALEAA
ncbi:protein kinase domain-containing protein [Sandaracinus amylolyticus]|uniref:protein kinase domain-containing protein n=1 Tax=Sandaracinus amylolyticus TaxID=927083 RepID=UPI001F0146EB|nr:protein kinase [Sandaracinus amylolyticus]